MKKFSLIAFAMFVIWGCGTDAKKPEDLIPEDQMVDILYDMSVLEAIRTQKPMSLQTYGIDPASYVYEKYKIDSLRLARSNRYYSSDLKRYKEMYDKVNKRLEDNKSAEGQILKNSGNTNLISSDAPQIQ